MIILNRNLAWCQLEFRCLGLVILYFALFRKIYTTWKHSVSKDWKRLYIACSWHLLGLFPRANTHRSCPLFGDHVLPLTCQSLECGGYRCTDERSHLFFTGHCVKYPDFSLAYQKKLVQEALYKIFSSRISVGGIFIDHWIHFKQRLRSFYLL